MARTTSYTLDESHLEALRSVCVLVIAAGNPPGFLEGLVERADEPAKSAAHTLSRPDLSVPLTCDLLARAGLRVDDGHVDDVDAWVWATDYGIWVGCNECGGSVVMSDVPRLISALANLAPGDKEGAMRALMEVGR